MTTVFQTTPRPKKDPLREFPAELPVHAQTFSVAAGTSQVIPLVVQDGMENVEIQVEDGGTASVVITNPQTTSFARLRIHAVVKKNARLHICTGITGGQRIDAEVWIELQESGSEALVSGIFLGNEGEHHGMHVLMDHVAPSTRGDIFLRGVLRKTTRGMFTGLIRVAKDAQQTNSYFKDDVLLMDDALAESIPTLEILANDVKASHGSTTGRVNDEQLLYLMSRGIPKDQATELLIGGFFNTIGKRIPDEVRSYLVDFLPQGE
ncbi:MAG: SufD family Fe-S cluster assembly protein [Patescibacteria group bacterium]|jgi:Fe-S cluster assembly scaffold protein SufB